MVLDAGLHEWFAGHFEAGAFVESHGMGLGMQEDGLVAVGACCVDGQ